jgi:hypothetical protein
MINDDSQRDTTDNKLSTCTSITLSQLKNAVRVAIGPIATPDFIVYSDLPKVRLPPHTHTHINTHTSSVLCNVTDSLLILICPLSSQLLIDEIWQDHASYPAQDSCR